MLYSFDWSVEIMCYQGINSNISQLKPREQVKNPLSVMRVNWSILWRIGYHVWKNYAV